MWRLKQRWYWPGEHNDVIRRLLNLARHDCEVIFLPGNHDEGARQYPNVEFGGIRTLPYAIHVTADGRRLLVIHGDQFDLVVKHSRLMAMCGGVAYEYLVSFNHYYNKLRACLGLPYYSLSKTIKLKVKSACMFISRFEQTLQEQARQRGLDGVVCGHIHQPEIIEAGQGQVSYYNCGDWIENCSALVEHHDGKLELLQHLDEAPAALPAASVQENDDLPAFDPLAVELPEESHLTFGAARGVLETRR